MTHYHRLPEATAKAMTPDGFYRTGDVFRRDTDGFFYFVGRADDMFVCGGENIYPGAVEQMLGRHPAVQQVAVVPLPDEIKSQVPVAFVVRRAGTDVSADELKAFALEHGPAYAHPRGIAFVDALPLAGTNKIDRRALIAQARQTFAGLRPAA
jgi:acyl-CoA synthetase (AMP-forming)/AMP-acid ligase II